MKTQVITKVFSWLILLSAMTTLIGCAIPQNKGDYSSQFLVAENDFGKEWTWTRSETTSTTITPSEENHMQVKVTLRELVGHRDEDLRIFIYSRFAEYSESIDWLKNNFNDEAYPLTPTHRFEIEVDHLFSIQYWRCAEENHENPQKNKSFCHIVCLTNQSSVADVQLLIIGPADQSVLQKLLNEAVHGLAK
jgi:hypothetical protein